MEKKISKMYDNISILKFIVALMHKVSFYSSKPAFAASNLLAITTSNSLPQ